MDFTGTIYNGMVVSAVSAGEKGVGLKVMSNCSPQSRKERKA
ncbi:hypothetical protein [Candidatus Scalindua japonica]|nr:hypothetical protein [Candidatus Scalindua japonica]